MILVPIYTVCLYFVLQTKGLCNCVTHLEQSLSFGAMKPSSGSLAHSISPLSGFDLDLALILIRRDLDWSWLVQCQCFETVRALWSSFFTWKSPGWRTLFGNKLFFFFFLLLFFIVHIWWGNDQNKNNRCIYKLIKMTLWRCVGQDK